MKRVLVTATASREIDAAASFYESRREGLGAEFSERVAEAFDFIERTPEAFPMIYRDLRRCLLRQFTDYALWYRVLPDNSVVVACLSGKRSPSVIHERAGKLRLEP